MIIEAMDFLYTVPLEGFCLVSSDSDFTGLAQRLREASKTVVGFGKTGTPQAFVTACDRFIYIENLLQEDDGSCGQRRPLTKVDTDSLRPLLKAAVDACSDDSGWATLSNVGSTLFKLKSDADVRTYGSKKLLDLFKRRENYEILTRKSSVAEVRELP